MTRPCRLTTWCVDDLCQHSDQGMCGLWFADTLPDDGDEMYSGEWDDIEDDQRAMADQEDP